MSGVWWRFASVPWPSPDLIRGSARPPTIFSDHTPQVVGGRAKPGHDAVGEVDPAVSQHHPTALEGAAWTL